MKTAREGTLKLRRETSSGVETLEEALGREDVIIACFYHLFRRRNLRDEVGV